MQLKTSILTHRHSRVDIPTPLLVPSFSSWAFHASEYEAATTPWLEYSSEFITEACLISAFDVQKGFVPLPVNLPIKPRLIILDSGGYEASRFRTPANTHVEPEEIWPEDGYLSVLSAWPDDIPAVFVSYDHPGLRRSIDNQIEDARRTQVNFQKHLHCFLIKPERQEDGGSLNRVLANVMTRADQLLDFDVIGITDKGLGDSPLNRMVHIARLRRALNAVGCIAPIHVFGSLDPLSVCLYYIAGAEIFDGLTWLRYSFTRDFCYYANSREPIVRGIHISDESNKRRMIAENIKSIAELQSRLRTFSKSKDFALLPHANELHRAAEALEKKLDIID